MRKWFGQSLRLGLAPYGLALVRTSIWPHERAQLLAQTRFRESNVDAVLREAERMLADHEREGWALRVVLSDELVRLWQVAPPPGAARMADLEAACALRYQTLFGASPAGWRISADWSAARPFLASAVPESLLAQLRLAA